MALAGPRRSPPQPERIEAQDVLEELAVSRRLSPARARGLRGLPGQVARRPAPATRRARARPRAHGARPLRPRGARADLSAPGRADGLAPRDAREPAAGGAHPDRGAARARVGVPDLPEGHPRACGSAAARGGPAPLPARRGRRRQRVRARRARALLRPRGLAPAPARGERRARGRRDHRPRRRPRRRRRGARLQGRLEGRGRGQAGASATGSRSRSTCSRCARCSA